MREDLQIMNNQDTRAITLAARTLRALLAVIAAFNLDTMQFDMVNAFLNSQLDENIYIDYLINYKKSEKVLKLNQILYSLRRFLFL